jgi:transglutaminase-like putative cysteine protease
MLALCRRIHAAIKYQRRVEKGVQAPAQTVALGTGSCRDMATLLMEAARASGVAARFASGYLHGRASMAGEASTHAWAEVYLPTLGWRGLDPTTGGATATNHIVTGVSTHPRGVMPVSGTFTGASADYLGLQVTVKTTLLDGDDGRSV